MYWEFADSEQLIEVIASEILPAEILEAGATFAEAPEGAIWVEPAEPIPRTSGRRLKALGIRRRRRAPALNWQSVSAWWEILKPRRKWSDNPSFEQSVILQIPPGEELTRAMREIQRLGGRIAGFHFATNSEPPAFLIVRGLPYFTWLAAKEDPPRQRIFLEHAPRIWIEAGYQHPLAGRIPVAAGRLLLIPGSGRWALLDDSQFRPMAETAVPLAVRPSQAFCSPVPPAISLPLRLETVAVSESPRLWVVAFEEFRNAVQDAGQTLLEQLAVAVLPDQGDRQVLIRALNEQTPPVLVWPGSGLAPSKRIPSLYLPVGYEVCPAVRADVLRAVLNCRRETLSWISLEVGGRFCVQSVSTSAFRPLVDRVEYVLESAPKRWMPWSPKGWEMEEFHILGEHSPQKATPERKPVPPRPRDEKPARGAKPARSVKPPALSTAQAVVPEPVNIDRAAVGRRLAELEQKILGSPRSFADPEHAGHWQEMARLHFLLKQMDQGLLCLSYALWETDPPEARWLETAWRQSLSEPWNESNDSPTVTLWWQRLRQKQNPSALELSQFVLGLVWTSASPPHSPAILDRLGEIRPFLERFENELPVRSAWLAWQSLARIAAGDVLMLARARDRFLERLFQRGVRLERDCPRFLISRDPPAARCSTGGLAEFRPVLEHWSRANAKTIKNLTPAYLDLVLAFGLARQGHEPRARELLEAGREVLERVGDDLHRWCLKPFTYRIEQALRSEVPASLPGELLAGLERFSKRDRFKLDRLRQTSKILEPGELPDSFLKYHERYQDSLARDLADLRELNDPVALAARFGLIRSTHTEPGERRRIAETGLDLAARLGAEAAAEVLRASAETLANERELGPRIRLLEKSLAVAAHFDLRDWVDTLMGEFRQTLDALKSEPETVLSLEILFRGSFQGLRRFGLRAEVLSLLDRLEDLARPLDDPKVADPTRREILFLQIACGRLFFEQESLAWPILDRARALLFSESLSEQRQTLLARAYIQTLGFAPPVRAKDRLGELFGSLRGISDAYSTSSHFFLSQLAIAEALVFALAGEAGASDQSTRRFLDEEEFLIRRRIHRDLRETMAGE